MTKENPTYHSRKGWKVTAWTLLILLLVMAALRFSLKTAFVHNRVKGLIISAASENLNGTLKLDRLSGDLWSSMKLEGLSLVDDDTLFSAGEIDLQYDILSYFKDSFVVKKLSLSGLRLNFMENDDGNYNVQEAVKEDTTSQSAVPAFEIQNLELKESRLHVWAPSALPDSVLDIDELTLVGSFGWSEHMRASVRDLSFLVREGRLPDPVKISVAGAYNEDRISLENLLIETGRSVISASGQAGPDLQNISAELRSEPLNLKDIDSYLNYELLQENLDLELQVSGTLDSLELELNANAEAFRDILIVGQLDISDRPTITRMGVTGDYINLAALTRDKIPLEMSLFRASVDGIITSEPEEADITWGFDLNRLRYGDYRLSRFFGSGVFNREMYTGNFDISSGLGDHIILNISGNETFASRPSWMLSARVKDLDVAEWFPDASISTALNLTAFATGVGFEPSSENWEFGFSTLKEYSFRNMQSVRTDYLPNVIQGQTFSKVNVAGTLNRDSLNAEGFFMLDSSKVDLSTQIINYTNTPEFSYALSTKGFDLREVEQIPELPTSLNLRAQGNGRGQSLKDLQLYGKAKLDHSIINNAQLQQVNTEFTFEEGILQILEGSLLSDIAEGSFTGRKNTLDPSDTNNNLTADLILKDIRPLAPLFKVDTLNATGSLKALVTQNQAGVLQCDADLDLQDIIYGDRFTAEMISGNMNVTITEFYEFDTNLQISRPVITGLNFQDIDLLSQGVMSADTLSGWYELKVTGSERGRILQQGHYGINTASRKGNLQLSSFDFITPTRQLSLDAPFHLSFNENSIQTDTLMLSSAEGAYLNMAIPYADSLNQKGWLQGRNFNFGLMQEVLFDQVFVDGILSGEAILDRSGNKLESHGAVLIDKMVYKGVATDVLQVNFDLLDERLAVYGSVNWDGEEKITGDMDVPFVLKEAESLGDDFFSRPVNGKLVIKPTRMSRFQSLLNDLGISQSEGILSFNGTMSGVAGRPDLQGRLSLQEPVLSGIRIDSAFASFRYDKDREQLRVNSEITAARQKAAVVSAAIPVSYDFRTFELKTPAEDDRVNVDVKTENFNLSVFNDFINREYIRDLKGFLNGDLQLDGSLSELIPSGYLQLSNAEARIPGAGLYLEGIRADMEFTPQGLNVKEIYARSGRGEMRSSGFISLTGITPSNLDLKMKATQFRLANTNDMNLIIDATNTLTGPANRPVLGGSASIRNGFVYLDNFGDSNIEEVELEGEERSAFSPYDSLAIDMRFMIGDNFFVRNRGYLDMEIELTGELEVQKQTNKDLSLFGQLSGSEGYLRPLGKRFDLDKSDFLFSGPPDNPELNMRGVYLPQTAQKGGGAIRLYYIVEGTLQEPEFRFESQPQMEESDIICYTLFNNTCTSLESWQSVFVNKGNDGGGASPTQLLTGVLLDEVEQIARQRLGIDVVQIDNIRVGTEAGTSIKAGWYLNRRTFFAIINEITKSTPKRLFILEYILSENTDLILTEGDDPREGVDIRWQFDY